jgi:hypothetical protein
MVPSVPCSSATRPTEGSTRASAKARDIEWLAAAPTTGAGALLVATLGLADKSDPRENAWHKKVCNGTLTLKQAQKLELAYKRAHG